MRQKVCVRDDKKGEERRVKVVIDGRPGLRPLPYSGQGARLCRHHATSPSSYSTPDASYHSEIFSSF